MFLGSNWPRCCVWHVIFAAIHPQSPTVLCLYVRAHSVSAVHLLNSLCTPGWWHCLANTQKHTQALTSMQIFTQGLHPVGTRAIWRPGRGNKSPPPPQWLMFPIQPQIDYRVACFLLYPCLIPISLGTDLVKSWPHALLSISSPPLYVFLISHVSVHLELPILLFILFSFGSWCVLVITSLPSFPSSSSISSFILVSPAAFGFLGYHSAICPFIFSAQQRTAVHRPLVALQTLRMHIKKSSCLNKLL